MPTPVLTIVPAAELEAINAIGADLGRGDLATVPASPSGAEPATHYYGSDWSMSPDDIAAFRVALADTSAVVSVGDEGTDPGAHADEVLAGMTLQRIDLMP